MKVLSLKLINYTQGYAGTERAYMEVARFITRLPVKLSRVRKCRSFSLIEKEQVLVKWDLF